MMHDPSITVTMKFNDEAIQFVPAYLILFYFYQLDGLILHISLLIKVSCLLWQNLFLVYK
jgi:hypothetical protein